MRHVERYFRNIYIIIAEKKYKSQRVIVDYVILLNTVV